MMWPEVGCIYFWLFLLCTRQRWDINRIIHVETISSSDQTVPRTISFLNDLVRTRKITKLNSMILLWRKLTRVSSSGRATITQNQQSIAASITELVNILIGDQTNSWTIWRSRLISRRRVRPKLVQEFIFKGRIKSNFTFATIWPHREVTFKSSLDWKQRKMRTIIFRLFSHENKWNFSNKQLFWSDLMMRAASLNKALRNSPSTRKKEQMKLFVAALCVHRSRLVLLNKRKKSTRWFH